VVGELYFFIIDKTVKNLKFVLTVGGYGHIGQDPDLLVSMPGSLNEETILNVVTTPGPGLRQDIHLFLIVFTACTFSYVNNYMSHCFFRNQTQQLNTVIISQSNVCVTLPLSRQAANSSAISGGLRFTKRCRLSWLTNSALVYEPICWGRGWVIV
jgi:hypothetical protein